MPLRAKIQAAALSESSKIGADAPQEAEDDPDDVLFGSIYGVRTIELNRPKKLNSLNASMIRKIIPRLREWQKSHMASVIIIGGAGEKGFCAGGDVAVLAKYNQQGPAGQKLSTEYFALEYALDYMIATCKKPYIAYMDGVTMGGGVGLSVHAPFRIATERTVFAMPETNIGFFPDVGGSFFLPRLEGQIGKYLALSSTFLHGANALYCGVATHYIHSSSLGSLTQRLSELTFKDHEPKQRRLEAINTTIEEFSTEILHDEPINLLGPLRSVIDRCFKPETIEGIVQNLEHEASNPENGDAALSKWADRTLKSLRERSPTSLKVTLRQLALGQRWSIRETFQREHQLAGQFMAHPDFTEGVTARLIEKRKSTPRWQPPELSAVSDADVDSFFRTSGTALDLPADGDFSGDYTFAQNLGLPREQAVYDALVTKQISFDSKFYSNDIDVAAKTERARSEIVRYFQTKTNFKLGVLEKVADIAARKIEVDRNTGEVCWVGSLPKQFTSSI